MEIQKKGSREIIWFFLKPYKLQIFILSLFSLLIGVTEAASVAAIYPILNAAFAPDASSGNFIISFFGIIAKLVPIKDTFITYCVLFMFIILIDFAAKILSLRYRVKFSVILVEKTQKAIFEKYIKADYQFFIDHKQGDLIYNTSSAPPAIASIISAITGLTSQIVLSISVLLLLFSLSWKGSIFVLIIGVGYHYFTQYLGRKISYQASKGEMKALKESNVILNESISGIKQVKVFGTADSWLERFSHTMRIRWYHFMRRSIWEQVPSPVLMLVMYFSVGAIAILMKVITPVGFIRAIPLFGTFAFAVFRLSPLISTVGNLTMQIMGTLPNCEITYHALQEKITNIEDGNKEFKTFNSEIKMENVSFSYKGREAILRDVNVTFEKGKTTAIVGRSGGGKTTLISIMLRLFDVEQGAIKIDGVNIKEYRLASWLKNIGYVSQDTFILNDTIENNITFRSDRYTHEDVIKSTRYTDAHEFISKLPEGYQTLVGDKGMKLSGGQAQRIAIARAMIRNPEILIFDEATNNLDNISEAIVQKAIDEISRDHTVIIIAHRLSTVINADKILVLQEGQVVEEGTHEQLLANKGAYWVLYQGKAV